VRTQVGIIGAGPAGLMLALLLERQGIESVVLENRSREYIERRVRAGLLEQNTVDLMHQLDVGDRLDREGLVHGGIYLRRPGQTVHIAIEELTGRTITIYGQQEVVKDMVAALLERGGELHLETEATSIDDVETDRPKITFTTASGDTEQLDCDFVAGCDGFHGISRPTLPDGLGARFEYEYPFGWLGILAEAQPATEELIYAWHERGFALYTMRSERISRLYLQVPIDESIDNWSDDRIWEELQIRLATDGWEVSEGAVLEKGITPMRTFVCEPMQYGRLFLVGDAAHIVPPTGAKGLNLAVNDARLLAAGLTSFYASGSTDQLDAYTETAIRRVWRAQDFSNYMTQLLHDLGNGPFDRMLQLSRLEYLSRSQAAATSLAENYAGLPASPDF
jgi:p-hydroxybenzoate 3-monooxygenase